MCGRFYLSRSDLERERLSATLRDCLVEKRGSWLFYTIQQPLSLLELIGWLLQGKDVTEGATSTGYDIDATIVLPYG